jgi:hypothetical protein
MTKLKPKQAYASVTVEVKTPVTNLFVTIVEDDKSNPFAVQVIAGKTGAEIAALASAMSTMMSDYLAQPGNKGVNGIIEMLSGNRASKNKFDRGVEITSIPEGICWALNQYRHIAYQELKNRLGGILVDEDEDQRPRLVG